MASLVAGTGAGVKGLTCDTQAFRALCAYLGAKALIPGRAGAMGAVPAQQEVSHCLRCAVLILHDGDFSSFGGVMWVAVKIMIPFGVP